HALPSPHSQLMGVESQLAQHGGVDVGDVVAVLHGVEADLVSGPVHDAAFDAAAGQPGAEALGMMVAAVALRARRATELRAPDHDCLIQHAALLEVLEQTGDGLIHLSGETAVVLLDAGVRVPSAAATATVKNLNEAHAALR